MDYLAQILGDPSQERSITIKTKPGKEEGPPEAPLSSDSANLPGPVLEMLGLGSGVGEGIGGSQPDMNELLQLLLSGGLTAPTSVPVDPLGGQVPMDLPTANPYGV